MSKYRKLPVVIDAFKWTGGPDQIEDPEWMVEAIKQGKAWFCDIPTVYMVIETRWGDISAFQGNYIVREADGEIYPCEPDVFEKTYELVE